MIASLARKESESADSWHLLFRLIKERSFKESETPQFILASGEISKFYFDLKPVLLDPDGANATADIVLEKLRGTNAQYIGGLAIGAVPIVTAVVVKSVTTEPIKGFYVRDQAKEHGTASLIYGNLNPNSRVVLVDDVTTTGGSVLRAVDEVERLRCSVSKVITIVDRLAGARENLAKRGICIDAIFTIKDFRQ